MSEPNNQDHPKQMNEEINIQEQSKNARNFTDLPEPYYSQRGELISNERKSKLDRQSERIEDRFGTIKSLESILSGSTLSPLSNQDSADLKFSEDLEALLQTEPHEEPTAAASGVLVSQAAIEETHYSALIQNQPHQVPENPAVANPAASGVLFAQPAIEETHYYSELMQNQPHQVPENPAVANPAASGVLFSQAAINESMERKMQDSRGNPLPLGKDNPSTPSDFSYLTKESVDDDDSDNSSFDQSPTDLEKSKKAMKKRILLAMAVLSLYTIFSVAYQLYQYIYVSRDQLNGKIIPSNVSSTDVDSYITAHPENRIGLWMECNDFNCLDLTLYCSADVIQQKLVDSGLVTFANPEQTDDFVRNQLHICPMIRVSRFTSVLSVFAAVIAFISLVSALTMNKKYSYSLLKVGGTLMVILTTITFALFISMKEILDHLVFLAQSFSDTGSSTSSPFVDTFYSYSTSFWICCVCFILSIVLLALFIVMSKDADRIREKEEGDKRKSETYSISTLESIDVGPRVKSVLSDASSTIRFNESIHNLSNSMDRIESFAEPPIATAEAPMAKETKAVRFS